MEEKEIISLAENHTVEYALGCGKSTTACLQIAYSIYCLEIADKLYKMRRIPRKMKKRYKKNYNIWNIVLEKRGRLDARV